ncbi:MAG TPA: diacylglycerol kinase [Desulfobulbus sp.]|nr:diacylglycerol kinase [Desulfobulbus sp.]
MGEGEKRNGPGVSRLLRAALCSISGLQAAWRGEAAFRQEVIMVAVLAPLGMWLGENGVERALLVASLVLVPVVELLNSAVEAVVDRIGSEHHPLSGRAKDLGSAAVLMTLVLTFLVWGLVLWH